MKSRIMVTGAAIVMAVMIAVGAFGAIGANAQAQRPTPGSRTTPTPPAAGQPIKLAGKVSNVTASSLTLTTRRGDFTVNITADTFVVVEKDGQKTTGAVTDLAADKVTVVVGVATADAKVVDAKMIGQGAGDGSRFLKNHPNARKALEHTAAGTITAINGNTITLQGVKVATVTVETSADTVVLNNGFASVGSLKVGDKVTVLGKPDKGSATTDSRTITAWGLRVENGSSQLSMARVDSVNGNSLTVKTLKNREGVTVVLDANTAYKNLTVSRADRSATLGSATQADVKVGSNLMIEGTASADGKTITAKAVIILPAGKLR